MHPPDPTAILAAAVSALGAGAGVPSVRAARGDGDWYSPVANRLPGQTPGPDRAADRAADHATQLAVHLRAQPDVSWAESRGAGVLFSVHTGVLARTLMAGSGPPAFAAGSRPPATSALSRDWPGELRPVAFAHARSRNQRRGAAAHGVGPIESAGETDVEEPKVAAQVTAALAEPHARVLLVHVATLLALQQRDRAEPLLLRETASQYQRWFAATRITPRGAEPVTSYHRIRLALNNATAIALAAGLASLGLDAPEHL